MLGVWGHSLKKKKKKRCNKMPLGWMSECVWGSLGGGSAGGILASWATLCLELFDVCWLLSSSSCKSRATLLTETDTPTQRVTTQMEEPIKMNSFDTSPLVLFDDSIDTTLKTHVYPLGFVVLEVPACIAGLPSLRYNETRKYIWKTRTGF